MGRLTNGITFYKSGKKLLISETYISFAKSERHHYEDEVYILIGIVAAHGRDDEHVLVIQISVGVVEYFLIAAN